MAHVMAEPTAARGPLTLGGLDVEGVNQCVHCGLCLAYCPTFAELGTEMDSPRGRIFLIKALAEGRIGLGDTTVEHLSLCLDCRACETVCPAGVPYGRLIEAAKAEMERQRPGHVGRRLFRYRLFRCRLFRYRNRQPAEIVAEQSRRESPWPILPRGADAEEVAARDAGRGCATSLAWRPHGCACARWSKKSFASGDSPRSCGWSTARPQTRGSSSFSCRSWS